MRIRSLNFRGIGPYRDPQHIDFDQLGASGLYLINGPTGAGKSTIIDAITFALYGKLSSAEADESRLRSDFAGPTHPTEVDLTFETSAGTFRVIRSPKYVRAAKRGTGTTEEKGGCHVIRIHPDGREETIAEAKGAADAELTRLIGLTREQFVQTVVLPQGQFATFLYSDTKDRAEILKRIFHTRLFERVAEILKEDAAAARAASTAVTERIVAEITHLHALVGLDESDVAALTQFATDSLDDALLEHLATLEPRFTEAVTTAEFDARAAQTALDEADALRQLARDEAAAQAAVTSAIGACDQAAMQVTATRSALTPHADLADSMGIALDDADDAATWQVRMSTADSEAGALTVLVDDEKILSNWPAEQDSARQSIEGLRTAQEEAAARITELPALIAETEKVAEDRPSVAEVQALSDRQTEFKARMDVLSKLDAEAANESALEAELAIAVTAAAEADAAYQAVSRRYRDGIAAQLSAGLTPGDPCPVCGSTEHPDPAQPEGQSASADEVDHLLTQMTSAQTTLAKKASGLEACREQIALLRGEVTNDRAALHADAADITQAQKEIDQREAAAQAAEEELARLREEQQRLLTGSAAYDVSIAEEETSLRQRAAEMEQRTKRVTAARGSFASVSDRHTAIRAFSRAMSDLITALQNQKGALAAHTSAQELLDAMAAREGFADVEVAQERWKQQNEAHLEADRRLRGAQDALLHVRSRTTAITEACAERRATVAQGQDLVRLADLFGSGRGSDIGVHIYVLKSLFASVMESANRRFESLLNGRYRLVPADDDSGDGRSMQGLGVSVEDRLTGKVRPARSLSGGETFCASLALALGLSDVVRMTAGGIEINSLFIDEGFGSLDSDQLDEVMVMLGHLSSGGRRVGLISHVDSMKTQITEQIDITPATESQPATLRVSWMGESL